MRLVRYPLAAIVFCAALSVGTKHADIPAPVVISLPRDVGKVTKIRRIIIKGKSDTLWGPYDTVPLEDVLGWK